MEAAVADAASRAKPGGCLVLLATAGTVELPAGFTVRTLRVPGSQSGELMLASRH
jgi:hypothetical protein